MERRLAEGSVPVISVLVVNYGQRDLLDECLISIEAALSRLDDAGEVIVIENGSSDGSAGMVRTRHPDARLVELDVNEGFAPAVVRGTRLASGRWLALVNNDARLDQDALTCMLRAGDADPRIGIVTAQVRFSEAPGTINSAGLEIDKLAIAYDRLAGRPVTASETTAVDVFGASACVTMYRTDMLATIGGFDASFFAYAEDADVSWRARMSGWRCVYEPRAIAYHHGSVTSGERANFKYQLVGRNRVRLIAKNATRGQLFQWGMAMLAYDAAYVVFIAATERTLAPLRGRIQGLREWRTYRRRGAPGRRQVELAGAGGWRHALAMRAAYAKRAGAPGG